MAKSHDRHVDLALKTHLDENLAMITDSIKFLKSGGQRVFLDAEHFFEHYKDLEKGKWVKVQGWEGPESAKREIIEGLARYKRETGS